MSKSDSEIAREQGISRQAIRDRRNQGWSQEEILVNRSKLFLDKYSPLHNDCLERRTKCQNQIPRSPVNRASLVKLSETDATKAGARKRFLSIDQNFSLTNILLYTTIAWKGGLNVKIRFRDRP